MGAHASSLRAGLAADFEAALEAREEAAARESERAREESEEESRGRSTSSSSSSKSRFASTIPERARNALVLSEMLALAAAPRAWDVGPPSLTLMMGLDR